MKVCIFGDARSVHVQRIASGLAERKVSVHVVSHHAADITGATVERFEVPSPSLRFARRWDARRVKYLHGFVRRFDVINVQFLHDWGFSTDMVEEGCFVASPWGSDIVNPPGESPPSPELLRWRHEFLKQADAVTAFGSNFASTIARFADMNVERIDLVPLGVDTQLFDPDGQATRKDPSHPIVGFVKGFRAVYGARYLLHAIPRVLDAMPSTRFELVGDGPELNQCRDLAQPLGIDSRINWLDRRPHREIPALMAGWTLSIIPSLCESFGAAALESSAMRVPVVASNVGGLPETVLHGETGLLVPPENSDALADAMIHLLRDVSLVDAMGMRGREMVMREFEWSRILDNLVDLYDRAANGAGVMV